MSTKRLTPRLVKPGEEMISPERPAQDISSTVASFRRDMQSHIREMDGKIREVSDAIADIEEAHRRMLLNKRQLEARRKKLVEMLTACNVTQGRPR